ncbi:hypothetical protein [Streptomyces sp. NPDC056883]|uniref:hypothetical protein n=1 Tax=Streptomyces sp. NPDC056883 TaxID=3345959 RepID=UPI0036816E9C
MATSKVAADVINSLLEPARAAAVAIRARVAGIVDVAAVVFVMNGGGRFHRWHLLAEARRHLALVLRGRRREPGLDEKIVATAISTHCLDVSQPKSTIGLLVDYRLYTARWSLSDLPGRRRPPTLASGPDRQPIPAPRPRPGPRIRMRGSGKSPGYRCSTSVPSSWCRRPRPAPSRTRGSPSLRRCRRWRSPPDRARGPVRLIDQPLLHAGIGMIVPPRTHLTGRPVDNPTAVENPAEAFGRRGRAAHQSQPHVRHAGAVWMGGLMPHGPAPAAGTR